MYKNADMHMYSTDSVWWVCLKGVDCIGAGLEDGTLAQHTFRQESIFRKPVGWEWRKGNLCGKPLNRDGLGVF